MPKKELDCSIYQDEDGLVWCDIEGQSQLVSSNIHPVQDGDPGQSGTLHAGEEELTPDLQPSRSRLLGIGGLNKEFDEVFRRTRSRVIPPHIIEQLGAKHIKRMLLHGVPGCGKKLVTRKIGKTLPGHEPRIVEDYACFSKLLEAAEEEQKKLGVNSGLHIIVIDKIDALFKQSESVAGASVVGRLLSKIDKLDNTLVIGITSRPNLIGEALIRPGGFEMKIEIGLPDKQGRLEILQIHCAKMIDDDVDLEEISALTKNFTGAELADLVKGALSYAQRGAQGGSRAEVGMATINNIKVCKNDFVVTLENDIEPAYGFNKKDLVNKYIGNGILMWGPPVQKVLEKGRQLANQVRSSLVSMLLTGPCGSGKTALAIQIALCSGFPFVKILSPNDLSEMSEDEKCDHITKIFMNSYHSQLSCIVIDDVEGLISDRAIGPNTVAQTMMIVLKKLPPLNRKLLVIATSSRLQLLEDMNMDKSFDQLVDVDNISSPEQVMNALEELNAFTAEERLLIDQRLIELKLWIGIKQLLRIVSTAEEEPDGQRVTTFLQMLKDYAQ